MRRLLDWICDAAAYVAASFILVIFLLMIAQSAMRELGLPTGGINDVVAWLMAAAFFLAMAHTFRRGDFVRVTLLLDKLSSRMRRMFEFGTLAVAAVFVAYLAFWAVRYAYQSWQFGDMPTGQVALPLWIPQLSFGFGAILLLAAVVDELIAMLRGEQPSYIRAVQERHARGDYSEDF